MTTMLNPMSTPVVHESRSNAARRAWRLGLGLAALLSLAACSIAMKFGYGQAAPFAFRWLDGFVEFEPAQATRVRAALDDFMAWHRKTQLPDYAQLLARAEGELAGEATGERMCGWVQDVRVRLDTALDRAMPALVEVLPTLNAQQIANIERKQAERNEDYRDDFLQRDPAKRRRAAVKREMERAESFYGRLADEQRELITRSVAESPVDGERSYAERLHRQQDFLETVRRLSAAPATPAREVEAQIRAYVGRVERSPREDYRRYAERVTDYNCSFASALHNTTTSVQRRHAARKLKGYGDDFRALSGDG